MHNTTTSPSPAVQLEAVVRNFGSVRALDGLDLTINRGEILALLGPNGAGKTTAVSLVLGLSRPQSGRVTVLGGDPGDLAIRRRIGSMLQIGAVPEALTVSEHLELAAAWYGDPRPIAEVVRLAGLEGLEKRRTGRLSGGQQRRLLFGLALVGAPELLVLDEPTVALDIEARRLLWERVRSLAAAGVAVLLTTHDLTEAAELAHRVALIHRGRVVATGTPHEVAQRAGAKRVRCHSALEVETVATWSGVVRASRREAWLEIDASDPDGVVRQLLTTDPDARDLEVVGSGLEDALLALTNAA